MKGSESRRFVTFSAVHTVGEFEFGRVVACFMTYCKLAIHFHEKVAREMSVGEVDWTLSSSTALKTKCEPFAFTFACDAQRVFDSVQPKQRCFALVSDAGLHLLDEYCVPLQFVPLDAMKQIRSNCERSGFFPGADGIMLPNAPPLETFCAFLTHASDSVESTGGDATVPQPYIHDCVLDVPHARGLIAALRKVVATKPTHQQRITFTTRVEASSVVESGIKYSPGPRGADENERRVAFFAMSNVPRKAQVTRHASSPLLSELNDSAAANTSMTSLPADLQPMQYLKSDPTTQLPYVNVPREYRTYFPNLVATALVWFDAVVLWEAPQRPVRAFAFIAPPYLYVVLDRETCCRCTHFSNMGMAVVPQRPEVSLRGPQGENLAQHGFMLRHRNHEHDLFLGFEKEERVRTLIKVLSTSCTAFDVQLQLQFSESLRALRAQPHPFAAVLGPLRGPAAPGCGQPPARRDGGCDRGLGYPTRVVLRHGPTGRPH
jgi:hypothetical protein